MSRAVRRTGCWLLGLTLVLRASSGLAGDVLRYDEARLHRLLDGAPSVARFDSLRAALLAREEGAPTRAESIDARRAKAEAALLEALRAAERGDTLHPSEIDRARLSAECARRAALALEAGQALDRGEGALAHRLYSQLDAEWREASAAVPPSSDAERLWALWSHRPPRWAETGAADLTSRGWPTRADDRGVAPARGAPRGGERRARCDRAAAAAAASLAEARARDLRYAERVGIDSPTSWLRSHEPRRFWIRWRPGSTNAATRSMRCRSRG
ncbi:MAG: hypothetical protein U0527_08865 [Candidatus Eisenbacteria bacterium]